MKLEIDFQKIISILMTIKTFNHDNKICAKFNFIIHHCNG